VNILNDIWQGLITGSRLDQLNLVLGIVAVGLMIRRSLWAFPVGMVAVTVQGILLWQATFYADAKLQIFFFGCLAYGWWHWVKHRGGQKELPISTLTWPTRSVWLGIAVLVTLVWGWWQANHTDAVMPYRDTFIASFSMVAQILQVRKRLENWMGWVLVNAVATSTYWVAGLHYTAFLFGVFLLMGISGWVTWYRAMRSQSGGSNDA
jgi:nicotinamide mononucleotide transporter